MEQGLWLPILGGLCFVLGIVTVGSRTIATVGSKITKLTQATAFSVQSVRCHVLLIYITAMHRRFGRRLIATTTGSGSDIGCSIVNCCRIARLDLTLPCGRPNRCRHCWEMHHNGRRWRVNTEKRPTRLHCAKEDRAGLVCNLTLIYFVCSDQQNKQRRPTRLDCSWQ